MSNHNFTPGPWKIKSITTVEMCSEEFMTKDCDLYKHQYDTNSELLANVKLIAAVPEMYEALKMFKESYSEKGVDPTAVTIDLQKFTDAIQFCETVLKKVNE